MDNGLSKNILYLTYDGLTDPLGQSQVLPYLLALSKKGYAIDIISFEKRGIYENNRALIENLLHDVNINWFPIKYHKKPAIIATLYDIFLLYRKAFFLYKKNSYQIVHCRSYITSLIGLHLKKKYGLKFLFDMRGFWADERVEGGLWNLKNPLHILIYKYFKKKEQEFLENADHTISLTYNAKKEIHSWTHIKNNPIPIEVIPCCVDTDVFNIDNISESDKDAYRRKLELREEDFVLTYLGSLGNRYMLEEMLDFFKILLGKIPKAKFLFITKEDPTQIYNKANIKKLDNSSLRILSAARKEVPILLSLSNYGIFFVKPPYSKQTSLATKMAAATKMAEILAMGKPIITNNGWGDVNKFISKNGILVSLDDPSSFGNAISSISRGKEIDSNEIEKSAEKHFSLQDGIEKYFKVICDL